MTPDDTPTGRWLRPVLLSAASGVAVIALWWLFVYQRRGQTFDMLAYQGSEIGSSLVSSSMDSMLRHISVGTLVVAIVGVALTAVLRRRWMLALEAAVLIAGANLSTQVLKYHLLFRPQYYPWFENNSYPSGHTTAATSVVLAALLVAPRRLRSAVAVLGALVMVLFGWATLAAHWHRPSDVVGGYLVCLCWAFMALCVAAVRHRLLGRGRAELPDRRRPSRTLPMLMLLAGLAALGVAALCGWAVMPESNPLTASRHPLFLAYLGGAAGLSGVAVAGMAVLLRQVQLHDASAEQLW